MIPTIVIPISLQRMVCTACGAEANVSCNCGQPYVPKSVRAREAVKANPEKSSRAIAAEIGVDKNVVEKARKELTGEHSPVDERIGLDGKTRKLPAREAQDDTPYDPDNYNDAFLVRADSAREFAVFTGDKPTKKTVAMARRVATVWSDLADSMEKQL
jgi:hypothetical protein